MMDRPLEPLTLVPRAEPRLWGGRRLAAWLDEPLPPGPIGEVWQVYDDNRVRDGRFAGRTLAELTGDLGPELIGSRPFERYGAEFPLLVKFLDTADRLSVQVHPDDDYARTHEAGTGYLGKNEAWYVLAAEPGAEIVLGLRRDIEREAFRRALADGTFDELLQPHPVAPGTAVLVPAGTIHTIGPGILLYEIQQKSDLTYRVYDYGRRDPGTGRPRDLHVDKALDVALLGPAPPPGRPKPLDGGRELLVRCESFALERGTIDGRIAATTDPATLEILTTIDGQTLVRAHDRTLELPAGRSLILPASLGQYEIAAHGVRAVVLRAYVPDAA